MINDVLVAKLGACLTTVTIEYSKEQQICVNFCKTVTQLDLVNSKIINMSTRHYKKR